MRKEIYSSLSWTGILITVITTIVNLAIFCIARNLGERFIIPLSEYTSNKAAMPASMAIIATIVPSIFAITLFGVFRKILPRRYFTPFLSVSITALIVSFGGPASLPDTDLQTKLVLLSMHIASATIIVGGLSLFHKFNS